MNIHSTAWTVLTSSLTLLSLGHLPAAAQQASSGFVPVTDEILNDPDPADWLMWRRTLNGWGYSPLDQIDRDNVGELRMVWTRPLGPGSQQGTPLVYDGTLYFPNPHDVIQAMNAATGELYWEYTRAYPPNLSEFVRFTDMNRNIAIYGTTIIDASGDGYMYALDAVSGELVWETRMADYRVHPRQHSAGPIVGNGKIFAGANCRPEGGPESCMITGHDAASGEELWRRYTIPRPGEPGDETWGDVPYEGRWHVGTWMAPSYDPQLNLVYIGTSVTAPAPKYMLAGNDHQYLYHNSTLALDGDTGEITWYYQHNVDHWDLDHPFERLLVDTAVAPDPDEVNWINPRLLPGEQRRVVTGIPGKTGIVYTLDRETGEFLWARDTIRQNVVSAVDGATGVVTVNPESLYTGAEQTLFICPTANGGKNWPAGAYSPDTNTMYMPLQNTCMSAMSIADEPDPAQLYAIDWEFEIAPGAEGVGTVQAISVETGETLWTREQRAGTTSLVATGGGLIFGGDVNGRFRAMDQETGEVLWEINLGSQVTGYPITFSVDGAQYVAVSTGSSLLTGGLARLTPELRPGTGNNLFVFALPD